MEEKKLQIITISGAKNSGKSTVIRHIHQKFCVMKDAKLLKYVPAGFDQTDFDSVISVKNKIVAIRSYGDGISYVRDSLKFAQDEKADILINAWSTELDKNYNIITELPKAVIHDRPVEICEPLRAQWMEFANLIVKIL